MQIAIVENGVVVKMGDYRELFPETSFPSNGPDSSFIAENGCMSVSLFRSHDQLTQTLVPCDPVVEDGVVYTVAIRNLTAEEIAAAKEGAMGSIRARRNQFLKDTDGTQATDNPSPKKADWAAYRQALRDLPATIAASGADPRTFSDWPKDPNWKPMAI